MQFHFSAFQPDGRVIEGNVDAKDQAEVLGFLAKRGLRPISVKAALSLEGKRGRRFFGQKITVQDKLFLTKYLGLMLKVGTDLFKAIDILIADFNKASVKAFMLEIRSSLERGQPFHTTFAKYPQYFSPVFVNLIKAGESSGSLTQVFEDLNRSLEKENELRGKLKAAFIYPVILIVMAIGILTFLVTFALPRIAEVFTGGGFHPPFFSRVVFAVSLFLGKYIWLILGAGAIFLVALSILFLKTQAGKRIRGRLLTSMPLIKGVTRRLALQRFAGTLASLLKSGLPIIDAIEITADAVGDVRMSEALRRISRDGIAKGLTVGDAFKREPIFPAVISNLIAVSEKAGHLDEILQTLSQFYESEIDEAVKTLVAFIEPALLFVIGIVVAVIALSIIVPIYQLVGQFS